MSSLGTAVSVTITSPCERRTQAQLRIPKEMVIEMNEPRCKIAAFEIDDPRCGKLLDGVVIVIEDLRCRNLGDRLVLEMEDPRCSRTAMKMEDPRCVSMFMTW